MTIWLDAHLSPRIARWINERFEVTALPLRDLGLRDSEDNEIWNTARKEAVVVMTKDSDFPDLVRRHGPPPQIIWLTCGNTSEERLKEIFSTHLAEAVALLRSGEPLVEIS